MKSCNLDLGFEYGGLAAGDIMPLQVAIPIRRLAIHLAVT